MPNRSKKRIKWEYNPTTNASFYALQSVAQHWVENEILIEKAAVEEVQKYGPKWTPNHDDDSEMSLFFHERDEARMMHDEIMIPMHRYSCVVMLYTTVERELRRLVDNLAEERGAQKLKINDLRADSYLARTKKFVEIFYDLKLADCPQYPALTDMQKIRDCIIHCLGEVGLSRDANDLVKLQKHRKGFFAHHAGDLKVGPECVQQSLDEAWAFFIWVFGQLNWKIASYYQGTKLDILFAKLK